MKLPKRSGLRTGIRLLILFYITSNALAESEEKDSLDYLMSLSLEELLDVEVTIASEFSESQLEAGSTVVAINEQRWTRKGSRKLFDAIEHLPSTIVLPGTFGSERVYIRGYATSNNNSGVAVLWDGISIHKLDGSLLFSRQNINLGVLERIEMIRGPSSALHGENAFHGVFSMRSFESDTDISQLKAGYASNGFYESAVRYSSSAGEGRRVHFSAAVSGQSDQDRTYQYNDLNTGLPTTSERDLNFQTRTLVLKTNSDPDKDFSYFGGLYYDNNNYKDFYSTGTSGPVANRDRGGVDSPFSMVQAGFRFRNNTTTDTELKLYYFENERTLERSFPFDRDFVGTGKEKDYGIDLTVKQKQLLENIQWSLKFSARKAQMGEYRRLVTDANGVVVPALTGLLAFSDYERETYSLALDAASHFIDDKLILRYGGRYDDYSDFGSVFSPRLGIIYNIETDRVIKFLYGHAFRAPNAGEVRGFAFIESNPDIQPETIDTYEIAYLYKTEKTISEFTLFKSHWHDVITIGPTDTSNFFGRFINTGENEAQGAEASFTYQSNPWEILVNGSYVQSENVTTSDEYVAFPTWMVNVNLSYYLSKYDLDITLDNRIFLDVKEGQIANTLPDPQMLKNYWRTDLGIIKHINKQFDLSIHIRNLFDRDNFLPSIQPDPSIGGLPDESISFLLNIDYKISK